MYAPGSKLRNSHFPIFKSWRIYPATSHKNALFEPLYNAMVAAGHCVFNWKDPKFDWTMVDPGYESWGPLEYVEALRGAKARFQFDRDMQALAEADIVVLILPSGASAHSEAAWARAHGKQVIVYLGPKSRPEILHSMHNGFVSTVEQLLFVLGSTLAGDPEADVTCLEGFVTTAGALSWAR
jgi:hypothetical protein